MKYRYEAIKRLRPDSLFTVYDSGTVEWDESNTANMPSEAEVEESHSIVEIEIEADLVRKERDQIIAKTDWRASSDLTMSQEWIDYRQALREVPQQSGFPSDITWPVEPPA